MSPHYPDFSYGIVTLFRSQSIRKCEFLSFWRYSLRGRNVRYLGMRSVRLPEMSTSVRGVHSSRRLEEIPDGHLSPWHSCRTTGRQRPGDLVGDVPQFSLGACWYSRWFLPILHPHIRYLQISQWQPRTFTLDPNPPALN
jgi:hypothetical protein